MSAELPLQEKLRKSEVLSEQDIYKDFMAYAVEVRDDLAMYIYMEENNIGTDQVDYWLARFKAMRSRCQMVSLVELIARVKGLPELQEERRRIEEYEQRLFVDLKNVIYSSFSGKRKTSSFTQLRDALHPEKRKIGNIEVYVDERYRHNYYIQDFAKYIEQQMAAYCNIEREDHLRKQSKKPPSFLAKKEDHLRHLADQLLTNNRKSTAHRNSQHTSLRFSNQINLKANQKFKEEDYQTPKNQQGQDDSDKQKAEEMRGKTEKQRSKTTLGRSQRDLSRDSVEILREMQVRQSDFQRSPKFKQEVEADRKEGQEEFVPIQRCRRIGQDDKQFTFSFGKQPAPNSEAKIKQKRRCQPEQESKDNAFIAYSFTQQNHLPQKTCSSEDFELQFLIFNIQREKYDRLQSQTFTSDIDSNQENYNSRDRLQLPKSQNKTRKPFEVLLQSGNNLNKEGSSINLEQLVEFDEEDKNPELLQWADRKNIGGQDEDRVRISQFSIFLSQQKRLSNISEEPSFFSQSKQKHSARLR